MIENYYKQEDLDRFISYFYQIDTIKKLNPKTVLEIGIGNKTVSNYLKYHGFKITTCDFNKNINPDYIADVRNLPFQDNSFDVVMACEILEHIPYQDLTKALSNLHKVTKKYVVISVPYSSIYFGLMIRFPLAKKLINKDYLNLFFGIPSKTKLKYQGSHYWEIGRKGYPLKKIRKDLSKFFKIKKEFRALPHPVHYFFVLEKKNYKDIHTFQ